MRVGKLKDLILINVTDPRRTSHGNIRHKLADIVIIGLCAIICNGEDYADMEAFGLEMEEGFRTFLELPNGIPDADTRLCLDACKCSFDALRLQREGDNPAQATACPTAGGRLNVHVQRLQVKA